MLIFTLPQANTSTSQQREAVVDATTRAWGASEIADTANSHGCARASVFAISRITSGLVHSWDRVQGYRRRPMYGDIRAALRRCVDTASNTELSLNRDVDGCRVSVRAINDSKRPC